ncbi:hypothetical protein BS78_04G301100 [Paspalum vaginatum]|nr:hypothetical protein BS78_04G301100 [Paspalum vaginatum]
MSRRSVNLIVDRCVARQPASTLHRLNPWRCFYPTAQEALAAADAAANNKQRVVIITEDAPLPRAAISFYEPLNDIGSIHLMSLGRSSNDIPHAPKNALVSLAVADDALYLLELNPGTEEEDHSFEALVHRAGRGLYNDEWYWRSLPPPPYAYDDCRGSKSGVYEEYRRRCYEHNGRDPYGIEAYAVVGETQIWISIKGGGTFPFDTTSGGAWSEAQNWALPFCGRVEYAPELALWFGFSSEAEGSPFAACDLGAASSTRPPVLQEVRDKLAPALPERWVPVQEFLLPLGSGKFCIATVFELAPRGWSRGNDYLSVETFVVLTGVEVERGRRGALSMIRHKSRRYRVGGTVACLL